MQFTNVRGAKTNLSRYLNSLEDDGPVIITSRGIPKAVITLFSDDDLDSFAIRHSEEVLEMAMKGLEEIAEGKTYSVDEALKKVTEIRKAKNDKA